MYIDQQDTDNVAVIMSEGEAALVLESLERHGDVLGKTATDLATTLEQVGILAPKPGKIRHHYMPPRD